MYYQKNMVKIVYSRKKFLPKDAPSIPVVLDYMESTSNPCSGMFEVNGDLRAVMV